MFPLEQQLGAPPPSPGTSQSSEVGICWGKPRTHGVPPAPLSGCVYLFPQTFYIWDYGTVVIGLEAFQLEDRRCP